MKPVKSDESDPFAAVQTLLDATREVLLKQPPVMRKPMAVVGLRAVIAEVEKAIGELENQTA